MQTDAEQPDPYADEKKYPAWAVTIVVVGFCAAFWAGASYIVTQLLG